MKWSLRTTVAEMKGTCIIVIVPLNQPILLPALLLSWDNILPYRVGQFGIVTQKSPRGKHPRNHNRKMVLWHVKLVPNGLSRAFLIFQKLWLSSPTCLGHLFFPQDPNKAQLLLVFFSHKAANCEPLSNYKNINREHVGLAQIPGTGRSTPERRCSIVICRQEVFLFRKEELPWS